jgi:cytochrome bd ubiquinol oxidase subunit I
MTLDPVILSRLQFFWVVSFHILLPAFTVGLACYIAVLEGLYLKTKDHAYFRISVFWTKIFAISFGLGVVSGIVMPFQFGTNWSRFSDTAANVIGPLMAYEGLTAFFLEASFLGVLLFGRKLVPPWAHFFAAAMVAVGTLFSSFWILALNSWMQTPAGYELIDGRFHALDWTAVIFNPSFPYRLAHVVTAFLVTTGFVVIAVAAYHLRRGRALAECRNMLSMTLWLLTALVPLQILLGDLHGLNTFHHQPAKLAAMEGHWETQAGAPLILFGWPDQQAEVTRWAVELPYLGSLILTHEMNGTVRGLKEWRREDRPPAAIIFWSFRIMVGIGLLMLLVVATANWFALERPALRHRLVPPDLRGVPAAWLRRGDRRLGHDGSRPAAVGDLWTDAHQ